MTLKGIGQTLITAHLWQESTPALAEFLEENQNYFTDEANVWLDSGVGLKPRF